MGATHNPALPAKLPKDAVQLEKVIEQVKKALDEYQKSIGNDKDALPLLSSAEFDFKTTTSKTVGFTINLLIFKFGTSHEKDDVNDVTFTYTVPPPPKLPGRAAREKRPPTTLTEALASTVQRAAASVKAVTDLGTWKFSKCTVNVQYGVVWDVNAGATDPVSFVTLGLTGEVKKNTVQSVKLVFGDSKI